ncbi:hypothetical protein EV192_106162 [Actinocrispum wychmicini]|uniref:DUF202 domain-containing protein n=1 Tax=Actinocrispum wychmicini TaxID=1213861 RepID=A0A4R2JI83_9PSEU|nr:hypothetical protein EV192_106162 [Actinocrispum wychmicini]
MAPVAVSLVTFRLVARDSMQLALVLLVVVVVLGLSVGTLAWRRYRTSDDRLVDGKPLPGGVLPALLTAMTVLTGLLGLTFVLLGR